MAIRNRRSNTRGYTLLEMMVVVGIVAIGSAIAIPMMGKVRDNARLRGTARETIAKLQLARTMSVNGSRNDGSQLPSNIVAPPPQNIVIAPPSGPVNSLPQSAPAIALPRVAMVAESVVASEFRIETPTRVELWTVSDQGNRNLQQVIDLRVDDPTSPVEIVAPVAPAMIRFKNGIKDPSSPNVIELVDRRTNKHTFLDVGVTGMRIRR